MPPSEPAIEQRLLQNDPEALALVIRWISTVVTWPRFWSLRREWPDLVQEALARVVESLREGRFDDRRDFHFYVQGIARHTALRALEAAVHREGKEHRGSVETMGTDPGRSPLEDLAGRQFLRKVMDHASEECRCLMRMYYLEEKSYEEIAAELDLPVGTVKSRLSRCLEGARKAAQSVRRRRKPEMVR